MTKFIKLQIKENGVVGKLIINVDTIDGILKFENEPTRLAQKDGTSVELTDDFDVIWLTLQD